VSAVAVGRGRRGQRVVRGPSVSPELLRTWQEAERRLDPRPGSRFVLPQYAGRSLPNLAASLAREAGFDPRAGRKGAYSSPLAPELEPTRGKPLGGPIVLFVVDGLGWLSYRHAVESGRAGLPRAWGELARPITSVFPTGTTCALTSLSTSAPPSRHGVVGHREFLPAWGTVADLLQMAPISVAHRDSVLPASLDPAAIRGVPTLFEQGLRATVLTRHSFRGSGFTRLLYAGAELRGYVTASDLVHEMSSLLGRARPPRALYVYWDELDTVLHKRGPDPTLVAIELARLRHLLVEVARRLSPRRRTETSLWLTGDHGLVPTDPAFTLRIDETPSVLSELRNAPAGDRRAAYLSPRPGARARLVRELKRRLPRGTLYLSYEEAHRAGWFGPPPDHPELRERTGELLVLPPSPGSLTYRTPSGPEPYRGMRGSHGGLERGELWVPLVAGSLATLADPTAPALGE
jgi:type I phosphodiesterase/nucleotide pyrophosphatase